MCIMCCPQSKIKYAVYDWKLIVLYQSQEHRKNILNVRIKYSHHQQDTMYMYYICKTVQYEIIL